MKTALHALLCASLLASAHAAPEDDGALKQLITTYQQATAQGDGKTIAAISRIPPEILAQKGEAEARAMLERFISAGIGSDGGTFSEIFTITRIDYQDNDTRAIIHGTAQTRDGQTLAVRWNAVKDETHGWQFDSMKVVQ